MPVVRWSMLSISILMYRPGRVGRFDPACRPTQPDRSQARQQVLTRTLAARRYSAVLPLSDAALVLLMSLGSRWDSDESFPSVSREQVDHFRNKAALLQMAEELDIPIPVTKVVSKPIPWWDELPPDLDVPCFVKPAYTAIEKNDQVYGGRAVRSRIPRELDGAIHDVVDFSPALVQQEVPGVGLGVHVLCSAGQVVAEVQQLRLREPGGGGGGTLRTTVEPIPAASHYAAQLMRKVGWTGPAMVELRWDRNAGRTWLMEVNCRFWGSLPLTVRAGFDFPSWEVHRLVHGEFPPEAHTTRAHIGVLQRNLRADLGSQRSVRRHTDAHGKGQSLPKNTWRAHLDVERIDDPLPALQEYRETIRAVVQKGQRRAYLRLWNRWPGLEYRMSGAVDVSQLHSRDISRWLFVCKGNICRSPFAEMWWNRQNIGEARSAGTLGQRGRISTLQWRKVAMNEYDVNLDPHRSRAMSPDLLEWSEIVVAMDPMNLFEVQQLQRRYKIRRPIFLLGSDGVGGSIPDPWARSEQQMKEISRDLIDSLERLAAHARQVRPPT